MKKEEWKREYGRARAIKNRAEEWRDISGYKGSYKVSNFGNVKSLERVVVRSDGVKRPFKERVLAPRYGTSGYTAVCLSVNSSVSQILIHRLVAMTFIPNPENKTQVNHINEKKDDNRVQNLEWTTPLENVRHGTGAKRSAKSRKNNTNKSRKVYQFNTNGELVNVFNSIKEASGLGFSVEAIGRWCRDEGKEHFGYKWSFHNKKEQITC